MAAPGTPNSFYCQTADAKVYLSWALSAGATSYQVQRSTDGVTYTNLAAPATNAYLDATASVGVQYYYQVASVSSGGTSAYTAPQAVIPCPPGEVSLAQIRTLSQQRADKVGSQFITVPEWDEFIRLACYELYDILIDTYEDYYIDTPALFYTTGNTSVYALPDGMTTFFNGYNVTQSFVPKAFYKLRGVDLGVNNANNGFVSMTKFNFADRNKYFYPNTSSTIYGVFNMSYRIMGSSLELIPQPSANQPIRLWCIPRLPQLLQDTDTTTISISGWIQYVIVRAAKYALDKEESDTSQLNQELAFLKTRIEAASQNRDAGQPDSIQDTRGGMSGGRWGMGDGFKGGW